MRDIPELTFRGALTVLGQYDRPALERLNTALGGVIMVGGVVALTGPAAVPLVGLAAVWGWVDQKNEALGLVRKLLDKVGDYRAVARGYDRTRLLAAAHTVLVASSVVEAFRGAVGEKAFKALAITDPELSTLLAGAGDAGRKTAEALYDLPVPMPSSGRGYVENLAAVLEWQQRFAADLVGFCAGLVAGQAVRRVDGPAIAAQALRHYQDQYRRLAVQVPEFLVWSMLNEHTATRGSLVIVHEEVKAALADQARAMSRFESLLIAIGGGVPDQVSALHRAVRAGLDEPVLPQDASTMSFFPDVRFPLVREVFVQPNYRCERVDARSRVADEQWWKPLPEHDNLDVRLAAHLASTEATRLPLLVLGHPGAGKSLLMKVLAARLPADQYTTVYVPLRYVSGTAAVYRQIEEGLARETNGRVDWAGLVDQSRAATRVILLDGLDEMLQAADRDRADYLHDVAEFQRREAAQERPVVVLVTSRTLVADRVDVPFGATVVKLEEFDPGQVEQWREVWNAVNRDAIDAGTVRELTHEAVARQPELARQPLLLLMLALYSADLSFPAIESGLSRTALYRTLFDNFTRREATKLPDATPPRDQLQQLSIAALGMFNRSRQHITDVELTADLTALTPAHDDVRRTDADQRLVAQFFFVHTSGADLETDRARRSYEFLHATFGEYLVAREIVDTLVDTADSAVGRRGTREPDDDRLFALLSHDCLATRGPILDFLGDLLAELPPEDRERIRTAVASLLAGARRRQGSARYSDYRPTATDHVREIAAYTANLVLLGILVEPRQDGARLDTLIVDAAVWRPTVDLWRSGLATDSWYALLAALERTTHVLHLSAERTRSTGLDAELRQAELAGDRELVYTLQMGRTIRTSEQENPPESDTPATEAGTAAREELLRWAVAVLAFGNEPDEEPMHEDRLNELFDSIGDDDSLVSMIAMVLKQRAVDLSPEVARGLVSYLLDWDSEDAYAFIAAAGAHPGLLTEFPQLMEADRYKGMQGAVLMMEGTLELTTESPVRLEHLLNSIKNQRGGGTSTDQRHAAAAALLDAFQWRIDS
ncbi:NACHT domain-containing protein [Saccharothrix xinjiangensis]|uniref:NACHT domain-containing protein n=1 Tax=Saccharothrix xinjiangensis TaxID=204798 RepID=A0ABV9Y4Q2_9PSEU